MELNREHFRAIIAYNFRRILSQQQCIGDEAQLTTGVYRWYDEFNRSRSSLQYEFREGHSTSVVVLKFVNYRVIKTTLGISGTSIHSILHEHLTAEKNLFVLHPTQFVNQKAHCDWSKEMLQKYDHGASKYA